MAPYSPYRPGFLSKKYVIHIMYPKNVTFYIKYISTPFILVEIFMRWPFQVCNILQSTVKSFNFVLLFFLAFTDIEFYTKFDIFVCFPYPQYIQRLNRNVFLFLFVSCPNIVCKACKSQATGRVTRFRETEIMHLQSSLCSQFFYFFLSIYSQILLVCKVCKSRIDGSITRFRETAAQWKGCFCILISICT